MPWQGPRIPAWWTTSCRSRDRRQLRAMQLRSEPTVVLHTERAPHLFVLDCSPAGRTDSMSRNTRNTTTAGDSLHKALHSLLGCSHAAAFVTATSKPPAGGPAFVRQPRLPPQPPLATPRRLVRLPAAVGFADIDRRRRRGQPDHNPAVHRS